MTFWESWLLLSGVCIVGVLAGCALRLAFNWWLGPYRIDPALHHLQALADARLAELNEQERRRQLDASIRAHLEPFMRPPTKSQKQRFH